MNNKIFKYIKYLSYVLLLLGVGVFVYFVVASVLYPEPATEFPVGTVAKGAMRTLIGVVAMLVIFFVSYLLSSDAPVPNPAANGYFTNSAVLKLTDVGLYAGYAIFVIAILVILWGEIRSAVKKG